MNGEDLSHPLEMRLGIRNTNVAEALCIFHLARKYTVTTHLVSQNPVNIAFLPPQCVNPGGRLYLI